MSATTSSQSLNGDLSVRAHADTAAMAWQASPSATVHRKRLHRVGPAESGQVTAVVRYESGASFPAHDHPGGEEILVLDGVFSDEHGDWPAGTYLTNPEGFHHAPFSRDGCVLFVKLRQFDGPGRKHVALRTGDMPWQTSGTPGIEARVLYDESAFSDKTRLERWAPGTSPGEQSTGGGFEIFVLEGVLEDENGSYGPGSWLRMPAGASHAPRSPQGCVLYRKSGAFGQLRTANV